MASILVIGIGSTGLEAMEQAQQFYYEFTNQHTPGDNAGFLFFETDRSHKPKTAPNGKTAIEACYLCPNQIQATLAGWHQSNDKRYEWLPAVGNVLASGAGAGLQPVYGRLALWASEELVRQTIVNMYNRIGGDANTNIYLVGSLTGGTGTGIFLDLAYIIRYCTQNNNIYGMFMLPDRQNVGATPRRPIYENAYSSVRTLDKVYSQTVNGGYECTLPSGTDISNARDPFYNVQFFTSDFSGNGVASLTGLNQLVRTVGLNLTLRMLDVTNQTAPFQQKVSAELINYTANVVNGKFTTIGLNVFQYPESLLEEYLTDSLLEENLLNRWSDTNNFIDGSGTIRSIHTIGQKLKSEAEHFVQESIEKVVAQCKGMQMLGKSTFKHAIDNEIDTINSGNYQAPSKVNYIYGLFDANGQKFCPAITGQQISLRDTLIELIYNKIAEESTSYQNLAIVGLWIQNIATAINGVLNDWQRRLRLDGTTALWNRCWNQLIVERFQHGWLYTVHGCKRNWYFEALDGVATLCYYNAFIPMLINIRDAILGNQGQIAITSVNGITLPSVNQCNNLKNRVHDLLNVQNNASLVARKGEVYGQMTAQDHNQIHLLFANGSCDNDYTAAIGKYHNSGNPLKYQNITNENLWDFLIKNDEIEILKSKMISAGLEFVQGLHLFANTDIVRIMNNLPSQNSNYNKVHNLLNGQEAIICQDTPAMAHLNANLQFENHLSLKLIVASPINENGANCVVASMRGYHPSSANNTYVQLPSLKNTVVVYQEYGYMGNAGGRNNTFNPVIHLSYQQQVHDWLMRSVENNQFDKSIRLPYIDTETLIDTENVYIK